MLLRCFLGVSVVVGAFVIALSQISSFFFYLCETDVCTQPTFGHYKNLSYSNLMLKLISIAADSNGSIDVSVLDKT